MREVDDKEYETYDDWDEDEDLESIRDREERLRKFREIALSHDPETVQEFFRSHGRDVPNRKIALLTSYAFVCNESFFTKEEQAEAEKWLRDNGFSYLIHKKLYN